MFSKGGKIMANVFNSFKRKCYGCDQLFSKSELILDPDLKPEVYFCGDCKSIFDREQMNHYNPNDKQNDLNNQERIAGLVNINSMMTIQSCVIKISNDLKEDGFDRDAILNYLTNVVDAAI